MRGDAALAAAPANDGAALAALRRLRRSTRGSRATRRRRTTSSSPRSRPARGATWRATRRRSTSTRWRSSTARRRWTPPRARRCDGATVAALQDLKEKFADHMDHEEGEIFPLLAEIPERELKRMAGPAAARGRPTCSSSRSACRCSTWSRRSRATCWDHVRGRAARGSGAGSTARRRSGGRAAGGGARGAGGTGRAGGTGGTGGAAAAVPARAPARVAAPCGGQPVCCRRCPTRGRAPATAPWTRAPRQMACRAAARAGPSAGAAPSARRRRRLLLRPLPALRRPGAHTFPAPSATCVPARSRPRRRLPPLHALPSASMTQLETDVYGRRRRACGACGATSRRRPTAVAGLRPPRARAVRRGAAGPLPRLRARGSNGLSTRRGLVVAGGRGFVRTSAPRAASAPTLCRK